MPAFVVLTKFHFPKYPQIAGLKPNRLEARLLGSEAGGIPGNAFSGDSAASYLLRRKDAVIVRPGILLELSLHAGVFHKVDPNTQDHERTFCRIVKSAHVFKKWKFATGRTSLLEARPGRRVHSYGEELAPNVLRRYCTEEYLATSYEAV